MHELIYKREQASVRYEKKSRHQPDDCDDCWMYVEGKAPACTHVKGPIYPEGWCVIFSPKKEEERE